MSRTRSTVTVLTTLLALLAPAVANAHEGNPDYRSEITSITPAAAADGLTATIQNFDDNVELVNRSGKEVLVKGYDGEPYVRIAADGTVSVNLNSPSYYLNEDRFADVEIPERADAKAEPEWEEVNEDGIYSWHDHRSHYMGLGTPSQVEDESKETKVFDYSIPVEVDGRPVEMSGTLTWVGKDSGFPVLPFIGLAAVIVLGAIALSVTRRRRAEDDDSETGPGAGGESDRPAPPGPPEPDKHTEAW